MPPDTPQNAQGNAQQYNQAFYEAILAKRYALGSNGYVDLAEMMRVVGRGVTIVPQNQDDSHSQG
jgi:hypothetical protein